MSDKRKILFMIPSLAEGGAEKVLVNLVNNMNAQKFDITVLALFDGGINRQFLKPWIKYESCFPRTFRGNSHLLKLSSPEGLYNRFIKERFDVLVSYLEGTTARVISGCSNSSCKLVSWIHVEQHSIKELSKAFRSEKEAIRCYNRFDQTVCVSQFVKTDFCKILDFSKPCTVLYNTVESESIQIQAMDEAKEVLNDGKIKLIAVGTLKESKGYKRLFRIIKRLVMEGEDVHLYVLGVGTLEADLKKYVLDNKLDDSITMLGYHNNPYRIVSKCDLFICASYAEGFSTAASEALIVGTPVCTVDVSGMKEMLGNNNEYGIITENSEESLYQGIKSLIDNLDLLAYYRNKAKERGQCFSTKHTVMAVEEMFERIIDEK